MQKIWKLLDGKKTNIGTILLILAWILENAAYVIGAETGWSVRLIEVLNSAGVILGGTGLVHKQVKSANKQIEPSTR